MAELERRVAASETAGSATAAPGVGANSAGNAAMSGQPVIQRPRRVYDDVVTADAATAVIVRWREARDAVGECKDALDRLNARERVLELEVELIEEHKLTLPPAKYPWDRGDRRQEVRRRTEYLDGLRAARNRLRLRRFLACGLWRN